MNTAQPIRNMNDLEKIKNYYQKIHPNERNYLLIIIGVNTALRISDILELRWNTVYDFKLQQYREHIEIVEQKTEKKSQIFINKNIINALTDYYQALSAKNIDIQPETYLFKHSNKNIPVSRVQAFRIIKDAVEYYQLPGTISCHSLRKTFGYHAWKQGISPALLVSIYNHSSYEITKRYLGIEQDDRDQIFKQINL